MEEQQPILDLRVDDDGEREITELTRWSRLMGILTVTMMCLGVLILVIAWNKIGFALSEELSGENSQAVMGVVLVGVLIGVVIFGLMMFFLLRASSRIRNGLRNRDQYVFNTGLGDLKVYFAFLGVFSILSLFSTLTSAF